MAILILDSNNEPLKHVHQWDVDRVLTFRADDGAMPHVDVVHVGLAGHPNATEAVPMATEDDSITITLPGWQFTRTAQPIAIYFYEDMGGGEMRTTYETTLPVLRRNKPIPYSDAEYARQQAELERESNELERQHNEEARQRNEEQRTADEEKRRHNEEQRTVDEEERRRNEEQRIANEEQRIANEEARQNDRSKKVYFFDYADAVYADVMDAIEAGMYPVMLYTDGAYYPIIDSDDDALIFASADAIAGRQMLNADSTWTAIPTIDAQPTQGSNNPVTSGGVYNAIAGAGKKPLKVTITQSGSAYTTDVSSADIAAAWADGRYVYAQFGRSLMTLSTTPTAATCIFASSAGSVVYTWFTVSGNAAVQVQRNIISSDSTAAHNTINSTLLLNYTIDNDKEAVNKEYVDGALAEKQDVLTFDDEPTENSDNPVTSGGVYNAIAGAIDAANDAAERAEQAAAEIIDIIDPSLTIGGKAADAEVVGEKFNELMREVWDYNIPVPDADITVYPGKNINSRNNMVDNDSSTCIAFVVPETGHYKMAVSSSSQLGFFIYDEETFTSAHFVRRVANEDALAGVLLDAGEVLLARAFSTTFAMSANYATAATVTLNPALPLTTTQDEQMRGYINAELDDVLADGYQHLDGEWARHGWKAYDSVDSRDFRVRYAGDVVFDRDVQIVAAAGFCVAGYLEDGTVVSSRSVFELPKGTKAHIYIRRWVEDSSEIANVAEFAAACSISTCIADIERYSDTFTDVSMFVRMGICGDSYAAGGGIISGIRPLTWGKNLERQGGVTVDIYAKSGQDVRGWVTNENNGLPKLLASPECGLYWMQHGINGTSTAADIGTPEDMSTVPHPNTFYGQYTEAIEQIKATFPNARIVLATVTGSAFSLYERQYKDANIAIRNIAAYCEVPCIEVIDDDFYKSNWYDASMRSNHPTAMIAAGMAEANRRLIARCIEANPAYFVDYGSNNYSVNGKGLSTNDYTDDDKAKVDAIPENPQYTDTIYDDTELAERVRETERAISAITEDAPEALDTLKEIADWISEDETGTAALINRVAAIESGKVNKEAGKGLSTNDYTTEDKDKLAGIEQATDTTLGLVKLNPADGVGVNDDGQLAVGGRIGQIPDGGLYYPKTAEPTSVGAGSLLLTDGAKGLSVAPRTLSIMAGAGLTCRSAAAGSTEYRIANNETNRFTCAAVAVAGARVAIDMNDASTNGTAEILSVKYADGRDCVPYFGSLESDNDIIITVDRTVNPDAATTKLRVYGTTVSNDVISLGQGVTGYAKGIAIGQGCRTAKQQTVAAGAYVYVSDSNSFGFGKFIYIPKQYCFATGQGHDFTTANSGTSAFGQWSVIDADTVLAVGNGTNSSNRSNVFEVKNNGDVVAQGVILTSPNGTKYRLTVADDGTLITTAV